MKKGGVRGGEILIESMDLKFYILAIENNLINANIVTFRGLYFKY